MAKRLDIKKLRKMKKKNSVSVNARKVTVRDQYLEETPAPLISHDESFSSKDDSINARKADTAAKSRRSYRAKSSKRSRGGTSVFCVSGILAFINDKLSPILGNKRSDNAALDFAVNHKRRSKREKRRRLAFICGGAGLAAAVILIALLSFGGASSPAGTVSDLQQAAITDIDKQTPRVKSTGAKLPILMTFTAAFSDSFEYIPPEDTEILSIDDPYVDIPEPTDTAAATPPIETTVPDPTPAPLIVGDLIDYFIVKEDKYYNDYKYSTNHYNYTDKEFKDFAAMLYYEARGEGMTGMVAVGNVIMNRVLCRGAFPNNITAVLSASGQFTPWNTYQKNGVPSGESWSKAKRAARAVLDKEVWVIPQDIYYFKRGSAEGNNVFYKKIGNHNFFRRGYSGRQRGGGIPPALYDRTYKYPQYGCKPAKRVYRIQYMLNKLGYDVKADSYFGITTKDALILFQKKYKLKSDGIAGPDTIKRLIKEFGVQNYYDKFLK